MSSTSPAATALQADIVVDVSRENAFRVFTERFDEVAAGPSAGTSARACSWSPPPGSAPRPNGMPPGAEADTVHTGPDRSGEAT